MGFENVEHELHKRRSSRNLGVGLVLAVFIAIVFGLTVVKVTRIGETPVQQQQQQGGN